MFNIFPKWPLSYFRPIVATIFQIIALDCAVAKSEKLVKLKWRLPYLSNVSSRWNNQNKHTVMKRRQGLLTHSQS